MTRESDDGDEVTGWWPHRSLVDAFPPIASPRSLPKELTFGTPITSPSFLPMIGDEDLVIDPMFHNPVITPLIPIAAPLIDLAEESEEDEP